MNNTIQTANERNSEIYNVEEFKHDVLKGLTVKRLMEKYNVSQYCVVEKKMDLNLLDSRYVNKMKPIKKTV